MQIPRKTPVLFLRQTPIILVFKIIFWSVLFNLIYIGIAIVNNYLIRSGQIEIPNNLNIFTILLLAEVFVFISLVIIWFSEYYRVDEDFIIHKWGVFFTKDQRLKISTINTITCEQHPGGKLFRYGNIKIKYNDDMVTFLYAVPHPTYFLHLIESKIEEQKSEDH